MRTQRVKPAQRRTLWWSLLVTVALTTHAAGCTRVPRPSFDGGWNRVPSLSWRSPGESRSEPAVPKVSANAGSPNAASNTSETEVAGVRATPPEEPAITSDTADLAVLQRDPFLDAADSQVAPASESRVQQLKQALSADARRAAQDDRAAESQLPLRRRIEALLRRSSEQHEQGQLADAKSTAQRAVELADEGQISFLPTELRPSDLLRQVTDSLDRAAREQPQESSTVAAEFAATGETTSLVGAALRLPVITENSDADQPPLGSRRDEQLTPARSQVAANRPMRIAVRDEADSHAETSALPAIELPDSNAPPSAVAEPAVTLGRSATRDHLVKERNLTAGPELKLPERAPEPPSIDPLKPLPKFRSEDRPNRTAEIAPLDAIPLPGVGLRGWSLWGPVISLAAIVAALGLGLLVRKVRAWR
ncbi:MAG TPA: hypothetical protein VM165_04535 [Planctomycetaceae bacterium]|nr:hypothetical protein [Planctomycetaceae bacterium]